MPRSRPHLFVARAAAVTASLVAGLCVAELGVGALRGFAYPYLNIFVADAELGVVLEPAASTRTRSRLGRITAVRTNAQGFRSDRPFAFDATVARRVLLIGDSQVFGYGVDVDEATASVLERELSAAELAGQTAPDRQARSGAQVFNLGVPTWGPAEHVGVLERHGAEWQPTDVVVVVNLANDWREAHVENARRHTARDGWARRVARSDEEPWPFPGRRLVMGRSQLVLMTRQAGAALQGNLPASQAALHLLELRRAPDRARSVITPFIEQAAKVCASLGCRVHVAVLPVDVEVNAEEWRKYRTRPVDISVGRELASALLEDLAGLPVRSVDLLPALQAASPGAFLDDDYHLSAAGHRAVARALLPLLTEAPDTVDLGRRAFARPGQPVGGPT